MNEHRNLTESFLERAFPLLVRYAGLALAMYEGFFDRPPQSLVIGLAALLIAGAGVIEKVASK